MTFKDLGINDTLTQQLNKSEISVATPIQEFVIGKILNKKSIVATSKTGSGKTIAYLLPLIQNLSNNKGKSLILAPTRELAQQIASVCSFLCEVTTLKHVVIYGGVDYEPQINCLKENPDIIIATPGRLIDLIEQNAVDINNLDYFVLDEVDQMLNLGFLESIKTLAKYRNIETINLYFSATMTEQVKEVISELYENIDSVSSENQQFATKSIEQSAYFVDRSMMDSLLLHLVRKEKPLQSIIFTRSRNMADRLVGVILQNDIKAEAIHSDKSQAAREHILDRFKSLETTILVATDVIARGIDIDTISHVFNYGLPQSPEQYIHRIGRTGRAGRSGKAVSLCCPTDKSLLESICKLMKHNIPIDMNHPYITPDVMKSLEPNRKPKKRKK